MSLSIVALAKSTAARDELSARRDKLSEELQRARADLQALDVARVTALAGSSGGGADASLIAECQRLTEKLKAAEEARAALETELFQCHDSLAQAEQRTAWINVFVFHCFAVASLT